MKKHIIIYLVVVIILLLTGCTGSTETSLSTATKAAVTVISIVTSTPAETVTPYPTPSSVVATPSLTPTESPSPTSDPGVIRDCLVIYPELPTGHAFTGTVVFENGFPEHSYISLIDLDGWESTSLASDGRGVVVSPDRTMFAYEDLTTDQLQIFGSDGKLLKSLTWAENWRWIERWLDNQNLLIPLAEPGKIPEDLKYPPNVLLFDPITNHSQILSPDYPDIDTDSTVPRWPWPGYSATIYSPDLKRVVYPGSVYPENLAPSKGYTLYGVPEKQKLAQIPNEYWENPPVWSPDGTRFIMQGNYEFYLVDYDGATSQITHLNPDRNVEEGTGYRYFGYFYTWSPDNRRVAFWLKPVESGQYTLSVLDTDSGEVIDYCISIGDELPRYGISTLYPVWSPDGKNLVVVANFSSKESNDVILVDLEKEAAYKIANNNFPVGWLVSP